MLTVDSLTAAAGHVRLAAAVQQISTDAVDSAVVESPLPGGVAEFARFLLNSLPPWAQLGAAAVGAGIGAALLVLLYRRRATIVTWFATRNRISKVALAGAGLIALGMTTWFGTATWNYTQHDNDFCVGCHVMNPAFHKFADTTNKHAELSCHDCHQQSMYASARQLYLWVAERPGEIGEHAKVPNHICASCHVTGDTARWQHVASTAGHRVHLESDSSALENLQCVQCHGVEVHRFRPVRETCGQSGCHDPDSTRVVMGGMAMQTVRHCTTCHEFTADVPALASRDSAAGTMVPGKQQCLGCHEMRAVLGEFDEGRDPHAGKCGTCHNPHTQDSPAAAARTCAECHTTWRDEPFHVGTNHRAVGSQCTTCHVPHNSRVDASDCQACHEAVRARSVRRPPVRFDTSAALRRGGGTADAPPAHWPVHPEPGIRSGPHRSDPPARDASFDSSPEMPDPTPEQHASGVLASSIGVFAQDTFPHARHTSLACLVCHETGSGRGPLTFERPRGCTICHHQAPTATGCQACHRTDAYGLQPARSLAVTVPGHGSRVRPVDFLHARHESRSCLECHTAPVTLAVAPAKSQCQECHEQHHAAGQQCAACHQVTDPRAAHATPEAAHQRCDACHTATTIAQLTPTRGFCATCHAPVRTGHYEPRECTSCHFLSEPRDYRSRLTTRRSG